VIARIDALVRSGQIFEYASGMPGDLNRGRGFVRLQSFAGACLLTLAALLPHAPLGPLLAGLALGGIFQWAWWRSGGDNNG
jgi:hypothetical protein